MTDQITLEDLFDLCLQTIRDEGVDTAQVHLSRITEACGTTVEAELPRFVAAAEGDAEVRADLLDELQTMGALMQFVPPALPEYDFSVPEKPIASSGIELGAAHSPADVGFLFG